MNPSPGLFPFLDPLLEVFHQQLMKTVDLKRTNELTGYNPTTGL